MTVSPTGRAGKPLLLVVIILLSGCTSLAGGPTASPTVTPVPVSTDAPPTTASGTGLPGVGDHGITNATRVGSNHAQSLVGNAFVRTTTLLIRHPNGTTQAGIGWSLRMGPNGDRFRYVEARSGAWADEAAEPVRITGWSAGDGVRKSVRFRNGSTVNTTGPFQGEDVTGRIARPSGNRIASFFDAVDAGQVTRRSANGRTVVEIVAGDISPTVLPLFLNPHGQAELRAGLAATGMVTYLNVSYLVRRGDKQLLFRWRTRFGIISPSSVNSTTPFPLPDAATRNPN